MFVNFNILNQLGSPAINSNTFANRPAAGQTGRLFVSTDTFEIYRDNGTSWDLIGGPGSSTITGTGTATQVAYFTSSQAIGSSANLFWDNTSGFLGVATATPTARIEAVKTDGIGIYANYTTNAGSGSSATAIWAKNVTNSSGFAAVIEETTPNATAGQYPLLIKHSLSSGTAGVGMGTGLHFQLPDDAGTFKTTQLTIETINAAAATYATRYRFNVQSNGSSTPVAYINATGLGIFTATPGTALDIHSTGIIAQLNSTSATANSLLAFQRSGSGLWRIGDNYGGGNNYFELFNTVLGINAMQVFAATNKTSWQATETYTTGQARANYFDYNLSVAAGGSFSSPNAITALGASLDLTLAGNATIPSGARSGLDAYNSIAFTGAGTLTHNQGTQIRAYSNLTAGWAFNGSATGTITHLAGLRALFPDNSGSAVNVTNNYALLLNDQTANTGTVTYTNRWGVYQEGLSDTNYFNGTTLIRTTTIAANGVLQVAGSIGLSGNTQIRQATNSDGNTLQIFATQFVAGNLNSISYGYTGGALIASVSPGDTITLFDSGRNTATDGRVKVINTSSANTALSVEKNGVYTLYATTAGQVGIGTNTPLAPLHVQGSAALMERTTTATSGLRSTLQLRATSTGSTIDGFGPQLIFQLTDAESTSELASIGGLRAGADNTGDLTFYTNAAGVAAERARITSAGLVGIGSTTPLDYMYISFSNNTGSFGGLYTKNTNTGTTANYSGLFAEAVNGAVGLSAQALHTTGSGALTQFGSVTNHITRFITNNVERARFTTGGNFLLGTTSDIGYILNVAGNSYIASSTYTSGAILYLRDGAATGSNTTFGGLFLGSSPGTDFVIGKQSTNTVGSLAIKTGGGTTLLTLDSSGNEVLTGSITTAAPNTGTAAAWKLGSYKAAAVVVSTTNYIEVDIGGTLYKLAVVT